MNKSMAALMAVIALSVGAVAARAQGEAAPEKSFEADKGPDTIDVSKYPKEQQDNYKVFAERCAKCHTLARPINSEYALPEEWSAYVDKMRHKKRSGIGGSPTEGDQKMITDFLIYDSSVRKKELIEKKHKATAPAGVPVDAKDAAKPAASATPK